MITAMTLNERLDILRGNLDVLSKRSDITSEQRALTLSEIARSVCEAHEGEELSLIAEHYSKIVPEASPADRIILCRELLLRKKSAERLKRLIAIGDGEEVPAGSHGKIAYPKNKYNDAAFELLSSTISSPRAVYTSSINGACEAVTEGSCEFCILPIENSLDGKLFSFYSLLDRFELKIYAACDIEGEGDSRVSYALVGRSSRKASGSAEKRSRPILEFFVLDSAQGILDTISEAAKECNAELLSIDTRPVPYDAQSKKFILSFKVSYKDAMLFCAFLALYCDSYSPIGLYPYLQN